MQSSKQVWASVCAVRERAITLPRYYFFRDFYFSLLLSFVLRESVVSHRRTSPWATPVSFVISYRIIEWIIHRLFVVLQMRKRRGIKDSPRLYDWTAIANLFLFDKNQCWIIFTSLGLVKKKQKRIEKESGERMLWFAAMKNWNKIKYHRATDRLTIAKGRSKSVTTMRL